MYSLGDIEVGSHSSSSYGIAVKVIKPDALAAPTGFEEVWTTRYLEQDTMLHFINLAVRLDIDHLDPIHLSPLRMTSDACVNSKYVTTGS